MKCSLEGASECNASYAPLTGRGLTRHGISQGRGKEKLVLDKNKAIFFFCVGCCLNSSAICTERRWYTGHPGRQMTACGVLDSENINEPLGLSWEISTLQFWCWLCVHSNLCPTEIPKTLIGVQSLLLTGGRFNIGGRMSLWKKALNTELSKALCAFERCASKCRGIAYKLELV